MKYWLFKSEPSVFSIDDLVKSSHQTTAWEGVRNYQARNLMKEMKKGDLGFFYHSNANPSGIVGIVEVIKEAHVDESAFDLKSKYRDLKSNRDFPRWFCVDVKLVEKFNQIISLAELKKQIKLKEMVLLNQSRLSVQPVTSTEWKYICSIK